MIAELGAVLTIIGFRALGCLLLAQGVAILYALSWILSRADKENKPVTTTKKIIGLIIASNLPS